MPRHLVIAAAALAALAATACLRRSSFTSCKSDSDCSIAAPHCEPNGACSRDDSTCPSGRRYHDSAGAVAGQCVDSAGVDGRVPGPPDALGTPDAAPLPAGRECVVGRPLPKTYSTCAAMVDAKEPRCGTEMWDRLCVRWASQLCTTGCAGMAFVGDGLNPLVLRLSDDAVLWRDTSNDSAQAGAWADYDDDGDPDLAVAGGSVLHIYKNTGYDAVAHTLTLEEVSNTSWSAIDPINTWFAGSDVEWADVDGDGDLDVAFGGGAGLVIARNHGNDTFVLDAPLMSVIPGVDADPETPSVVRMAFGDHDGNGSPDLIVGRFGHPYRLYDNSKGAFTIDAWTGPSFAGGVEWCNLDADPEPELVVAGYSFADLFDNSGGTLEATPHSLSGQSTSDIRCADLDGDGDLDLFGAGGDGFAARTWTNTTGQLSGFSQTWSDTTTPANTTNQWSGDIADLDGDHKLDAIGSGNNQSHPVQFQTYLNASTTNHVKLTVPALTTLPAEDSYACSLTTAPLVGH